MATRVLSQAQAVRFVESLVLITGVVRWNEHGERVSEKSRQMMAAIQMNNTDNGQVSRLFSSPVMTTKTNAVSMCVQESPSGKCDTAGKIEENGYVHCT